MIEWIACKDRMPEKGAECLLYAEEQDAAIGPYPWVVDNEGKNGSWIDLFATPEAGHSYSPPLITHWAVWNAPNEA